MSDESIGLEQPQFDNDYIYNFEPKIEKKRKMDQNCGELYSDENFIKNQSGVLF